MPTFKEILISNLETAPVLTKEEADEITTQSWNEYQQEHVGGRPDGRG